MLAEIHIRSSLMSLSFFEPLKKIKLMAILYTFSLTVYILFCYIYLYISHYFFHKVHQRIFSLYICDYFT